MEGRVSIGLSLPQLHLTISEHSLCLSQLVVYFLVFFLNGVSFGLKLFYFETELLLFLQTALVMFLVLGQDFVVMSNDFPITADGTLGLRRSLSRFGFSELIGQSQVFLRYILYLFFEFPLFKGVVFFLLRQSQFILFDQRLHSEFIFSLDQSETSV